MFASEVAGWAVGEVTGGEVAKMGSSGETVGGGHGQTTRIAGHVRRDQDFAIVGRVPPQPRKGPRPARAKPGVPSTLTLRIETIAAGGAGVARTDAGLAVFVPRTAPGELVEADVTFASRPAQGRLLRVIEPAPERVAPPCPFVEACGGCDLMHLKTPAQEAAHAALVARALAHALPSITVPPVRVHAALAAMEYRSRARFFARAVRGHVQVGYRAQASHDLVSVDACAVLSAALAPLLSDLPVVLAGAKGEGDVLVALGADGLPVVEVAWRGELLSATWAAIDDLVARHAWAGARVALEGVTAPASFGDPRAAMLGADGAPMSIAAGGFAQASEAGSAMLARRVAELASLSDGAPGEGPLWKTPRPGRMVELFAGSGTLSILLARAAEQLTTVEVDAAAVACAQQNVAARALSARVTLGDAGAFPIPPKTDVVVLDPPREGAASTARALAASSARAIVYVSCDPATLARDLAILLAAPYVITHVETLELFPQTSHVETVVRLARVRVKPPAGR